MEVLIAEDDAVSRRLLEVSLVRWGYQVIEAKDGIEALQVLSRENCPPIAILDWMMPGMDGIELCRRVRADQKLFSVHIILLTAKNGRGDIVEGLGAGADDYISKPFDREELRARVQVGIRLVELQRKLAERVEELSRANQLVKQLHGLLPICSYCKQIRDGKDHWQRVETYISKHSEAEFTHSICPDCYENIVKPELMQLSPLETTKK
ncbi:MAG TPA: response regulator [Terriglobia bacterium]|nr:response regulator [Terriglobia bacterium]